MDYRLWLQSGSKLREQNSTQIDEKIKDTQRDNHDKPNELEVHCVQEVIDYERDYRKGMEVGRQDDANGSYQKGCTCGSREGTLEKQCPIHDCNDNFKVQTYFKQNFSPLGEIGADVLKDNLLQGETKVEPGEEEPHIRQVLDVCEQTRHFSNFPRIYCREVQETGYAKVQYRIRGLSEGGRRKQKILYLALQGFHLSLSHDYTSFHLASYQTAQKGFAFFLNFNRDKINLQSMPEPDNILTEDSLDETTSEADQNCPQVDRLLNYEPNFGKICINVAFTKYPIVREIAKKMKWVLIEDRKDGKWDVCWTDIAIRPETLIRMHFHQSINYLPGIAFIARKDLLANSLNLMRNSFPNDYSFFPQTWILPQDYSSLRKRLLINKMTLIVKPAASCQGRGIYLANSLENFRKGKHCVVQRYLSEPFLIDNLKFDLRIYALIGSIEPLKIYLYKQGLARFATEKYEMPSTDNYSDNFLHLTNYAINKHNPAFKQAGQDSSQSHKRPMSAIFTHLKQRGLDTTALMVDIQQIIVKTIITCYQRIHHNYVHCQPAECHNRMAFHILGFDILIDSKLKPILLEVNHTPSFATDSPLDKKIKGGLIGDTFRLIGFNSKLKQSLFEKARSTSINRVENGKRQMLNEAERLRQIRIHEQQIEEYRANNLGGYEQIYPSKESSANALYQRLLKEAGEIIKRPEKPKKLKVEVTNPKQEQISKTIAPRMRFKQTRSNSCYEGPPIRQIQIIQPEPSRNFRLSKSHLRVPEVKFNVYEPQSMSVPRPELPMEHLQSSILRGGKKQMRKSAHRQTKEGGIFLKPKVYEMVSLKLEGTMLNSKDVKNMFVSVRL